MSHFEFTKPAPSIGCMYKKPGQVNEIRASSSCPVRRHRTITWTTDGPDDEQG